MVTFFSLFSVTLDKAPDSGILQRTVTAMDAINFFTEVERDKDLQKLKEGRGDHKNTVLVLPKVST